jgi:hypothetical protein
MAESRPLPDQNGRDALSRVANAARDVADGYLRVERDMERLPRAVESAGGAENPDIVMAIRASLRGRQVEAWNTIAGKLR